MPIERESPVDPAVHEVPKSRLRSRADAEAYVASVCFKHGPPRLLGVELEWTVHHAGDPRRPLDPERLERALGSHTPTSLAPASPNHELPNGSSLTLEPGGQIEISSVAHESMTTLFESLTGDIAYVRQLCDRAGLVLGERGVDPWRPPRRLLPVARYAAMEHAFERIGSGGKRMMCSTAGIQVCLDIGERNRVGARWTALHALGPVLTATFANSPVLLGGHTGWASSRARALLHTDPHRTRPAPVTSDPAGAWARHVLDAPIVCLRRDSGDWSAPNGISFAEWIGGSLGEAPTYEDLDYHLTTMFSPVRPRGYFEVRYVDAQHGDEWMLPAAALIALFRSETAVDKVIEETSAVADRWVGAARHGLADPELARAAEAVFDLACRCLEATSDSPAGLAERMAESVRRRLETARRAEPVAPRRRTT
ncbi:ergothioneine biosynthesis glutamate--cysteine ligase EgtA [Actinopolyspora erythraea]|uniref:ergothioneine biosynthesis glutamate--cysteine ligase EgtA n=1 Tax=Actinopolyspora erythraea TaxID=414996 RepID=UPI0006936E77|nr:ergothioneine biosynthesis glutamate--cysteine ligase EgtA [Actinopolyspora erythraea]